MEEEIDLDADPNWSKVKQDRMRCLKTGFWESFVKIFSGSLVEFLHQKI